MCSGDIFWNLKVSEDREYFLVARVLVQIVEKRDLQPLSPNARILCLQK